MSQLSRRRFVEESIAAAGAVATGRSLWAGAVKPASRRPVDPGKAERYFEQFREEELAATGKPCAEVWPWAERNIPLFEGPDALIEKVYYFRWYSLYKHIVDSSRGRLLTEFLLPVPWGGYAQTIPDAVPHHLREVRWLRQETAARDYARFWCSPAATPRSYSLALADAVRSVVLVQGGRGLIAELLPALSTNREQWEVAQRDTNGLFWSIDTRDAMEVSISGDGYRPSLNSYMYGDAAALAAMARQLGDTSAAGMWENKAAELRCRVERGLWNPAHGFYEVRSPAPNSGIRGQKRFKDNGTALKLANVRELIGYVPWYYHLPAGADRAVAWRQLFDVQGFQGRYGPTTAERRSPRFRFPNDDQCQWNGPTWAFATTQTLVALGNLLNGPAQPYIGKAEYLRLMRVYAHGHRLILSSGRTVTWLDEAQDADTGAWITRTLLHQRNSPLQGRGSYYNHSGFADPLITGLVGVRPREDRAVVIHPLLPDGAWEYFALEGLPYHGHLLRVQYDSTGRRYGEGTGMRLWIDDKLAASRNSLGPLRAELPEKERME